MRKFVHLISSSITIGSGGNADLPSGYTNGLLVIISYWGYNGIRSTYVGASGNINLMVASSSTNIGYIHLDVSTGKITNSAGTSVTIQNIIALVSN